MSKTRIGKLLSEIEPFLSTEQLAKDPLINGVYVFHLTPDNATSVDFNECISIHVSHNSEAGPLEEKHHYPTYGQFLKTLRKMPSDENFEIYLTELKAILKASSGKVPLTASEQKQINARKTWSEVVSHVDELNAARSFDIQSPTNAICGRLTKLGLLNGNLDPHRIISEAVHFLQHNTVIVMTFNATFLHQRGLTWYQTLNQFEKDAQHNRVDAYAANRDETEKDVFSPLSDALKEKLLGCPEARPKYAAIKMLDKDHFIEATTWYGKSYVIFDDKIKLNALYNPYDSMGGKFALGKTPLPCTYHHLELILLNCTDTLLRALVTKVTTGHLPKEYTQQGERDPNNGGYIEVMLPALNLLDPSIVKHIHIDSSEHKMNDEEFKAMGEIRIPVTNTETNPFKDNYYKETCTQLINYVKDNNLIKVKELLNKYSFLTHIRDENDQDLITIAGQLNLHNMVLLLFSFGGDPNSIFKLNNPSLLLMMAENKKDLTRDQYQLLKTGFHDAIKDEKPNLALIRSLIPKLYAAKNDDHKTGFLIAAERNNSKVIQLFFEDKESLTKYHHNQLEKIIETLLKNNHVNEAEKLFEISLKRPEFFIVIDKWLQSPQDFHLALIAKYIPEKILEGYEGNTSYLAFLLSNNNQLYKRILLKSDVISKLDDHQKGEALFWLVVHKEYEDAKKLLNNHPTTPVSWWYPDTKENLLHQAIMDEKPNVEFIKQLIPLYSVILHDTTTSNKTALLIAAEKNNPKVIQLFFEDKDSLSKYDNNQLEKIIFLLCKNNHWKWTETLLDIALNKPGFWFSELFDRWSNHPNLSESHIHLMIRYTPKKIMAKYREFTSYLAYLCSNNNILFKVILDKTNLFAELNEYQQAEVLLHLIRHKYYKEANNLLRLYPIPHINIPCPESKNSALLLAVLDEKPNTELIELLLPRSIHVIQNTNNENKTAFLIAAEKDNLELVKLFLGFKDSLSKYSNDQLERIIYILMNKNHFKQAEALLEVAVKKPNFAVQINKWLNKYDLFVYFLKLIIKHASEEIIKPFNKSLSYISYLSWHNKEPLLKVVLEDSKLIAKLNDHQRGELLLDLISLKRNDDAKKLLKEHPSTKIGCQFIANLNTCLHTAVLDEKPDVELIKLLASTPAGLSEKNKEEKTPLNIAIEQNNIDVISILLLHEKNLKSYDINYIEKLLTLLSQQGKIEILPHIVKNNMSLFSESKESAGAAESKIIDLQFLDSLDHVTPDLAKQTIGAIAKIFIESLTCPLEIINIIRKLEALKVFEKYVVRGKKNDLSSWNKLIETAQIQIIHLTKQNPDPPFQDPVHRFLLRAIPTGTFQFTSIADQYFQLTRFSPEIQVIFWHDTM